MREIDERVKDDIQKFYCDYLLARLFGWEVSYKPYRLVQPVREQITKLARHVKLPPLSETYGFNA